MKSLLYLAFLQHFVETRMNSCLFDVFGNSYKKKMSINVERWHIMHSTQQM